MRVYNKYILLLAVLFLLTTVALAFVGETRWDLYFALYLIECLVVTLFFAHLNRSARRALGVICLLLFAFFILIVINRVLMIVLGIGIQ